MVVAYPQTEIVTVEDNPVGIELGTVAVVGHHGLMGSEFVKRGCVPLPCDISQAYRIAQELHNLKTLPRVIVNCAAKTDVDSCEVYPGESCAVNVHGVYNLVKAIETVYDGKNLPLLIHYSSDFIFDGKNRLDSPYAEEDKPNPQSVYGMQKWLSEKIVAKYLNALIIRTTVIFGLHPHKATFVRWLLNNWKMGFKTPIVKEMTTSPTYAPDLARMTLELAAKFQAMAPLKTIVYNIANGYVTRAVFAAMVAEAFGYDPRACISLIEPEEYRPPAPRPLYGGLRTQKIIDLGIRPMSITDALYDLADKHPEEVYRAQAVE